MRRNRDSTLILYLRFININSLVPSKLNNDNKYAKGSDRFKRIAPKPKRDISASRYSRTLVRLTSSNSPIP